MKDSKDKVAKAKIVKDEKVVEKDGLTDGKKGRNNKKVAVKEQNFRSERKLLVILAVIFGILLVAMVAVAIALLVIRPWENGKKTDENLDENIAKIEKIEGVNYEQKITSEDGGEFSPKVVAGAESNLAMRFSELKCSDDCKNIENVKFGDRTLTLGKDYEVKQGSVIIIIFAAVFSEAEPGEMTITFEITEDNKIQTIGVKITIEKKEEEKEEQSTSTSGSNTSGNTAGNTNSNTSANTSSNTASNAAANAAAAAKAACEAKAGPIGVTIFNFLTSAEKKAWIAQYAPDYPESEVAALYTSFSGSQSKMKYVDGQCRPSIGSDWTGVSGMPISEDYLKQSGVTMMKDHVAWTYADGHVENMVLANPNVIWSW